jgi:hypothetical protein
MLEDFMRGGTDGIERALDAALAMTFPASDPVAISVPSARFGIRLPRNCDAESGRQTDLVGALPNHVNDEARSLYPVIARKAEQLS